MYLDRLSDSALDYALANEDHRCSWNRSKRGNWWRRWSNLLLTVFPRGDGWRWCVSAAGENPTFSPRAYRTQQEASTAAVKEADRRLGTGWRGAGGLASA